MDCSAAWLTILPPPSGHVSSCQGDGGGGDGMAWHGNPSAASCWQVPAAPFPHFLLEGAGAVSHEHANMGTLKPSGCQRGDTELLIYWEGGGPDAALGHHLMVLH